MTAHEHHGPSYMNYVMIFVGLLALTATTVAISYTSLPEGTKELCAFAIAALKAVLVGSIFMHLKFEPRLILYFAVTPLVLTLIFILAISPDVGISG